MESAPFSAVIIIPGALQLVSIPKAKLPEVTNALLNVFLHATNTKFFSFTHSPDGVTIIVPADKMKLFPSDVLTTPGYPWRGIRVSLGSCGINESGVVSSISKLLSDNNINIHYLSTYSTDFILIPEQKLSKAIRCLQQKNIDVTWEEEETIPDVYELNKDSIPPTNAPAGGHANNTLITLQKQLYIASLKKRDSQSCTQAILRLVFFPQREDAFFSYTEVEDEISMILDVDSLPELKHNKHIMIEEDCWRMITRYSKLSLEETGIVYSISHPLAKANINLLYLSTFFSSYIMVRDDKFAESTSLLRQNGFDVNVAGA